MNKPKYPNWIKIKFNFPLVFVLFFLVPLFPIVQDQWLNISLLDESDFSSYSILYYFSGLLFPLIILINSRKNYLNYKFESNLSSQKKDIKFLFYAVTLILLTLSFLISKYIIFTFYFFKIIPTNGGFIDIKYEILIILTIIILLLINKTRNKLKNLFIINFFINSIFIWTNYFLIIYGFNKFTYEYFLDFKILNIINVIYLYLIEILFYLWSYLSYKNNLSDWSVPYPSNSELKPIFKITIFYLGILVYYFIFNRLN